MNKDHKSLLQMKDIHIQGYSDEKWHDIIIGVDISLNRGEVLGLIGESGAGKSTLGLAAMGFARPGCKIIKGEIVFDGIDLIQASEKEKRNLRGSRISYVAQSAAASFNPAHRLIEQTIESSIHHKLKKTPEAKDDAKDLFQSLQLPEPHQIGERYPHQVSGGQLQRTMTAMAMSSKPDLIIFDEPTTALDVTTQVDVLSSIRSVVREFNTAAIYITHDLAVVAQMADKIKVLRYGKTVEDAGKKLEMVEESRKKNKQNVAKVETIEKLGKQGEHRPQNG